MNEKRTIKIKLWLALCLLFLIFLGIIILGIWLYYDRKEINSPQIKSQSYENKFDKIQIIYDYGNIMNFSGTYENQDDNALEINLNGEQLTELQNIFKKYDIESDKYKIKDTGHYHGLTYYSNIIILPGTYKVIFNDGSEMMIEERNYQIQYKKGKNYYIINDGKEISQKIINLVDEKLHEEDIIIDTQMISITGLTSGNTLNISDQETIFKILNEFRYAKDEICTEELYNRLLEYEKEDYDYNRENYRELEYKIDFNNGTIIKIELRNGNVGCISDENNSFIEGIKINSKFIFMIHNIYTDYYKENNKLFESEEIYIQHNNIERKLSDIEKTEFLNKLLMVEIDGEKLDDPISPSTNDYILKINNNQIILNQKNLYIIYANGNNSYINSISLADYIKNLIE